MRPAHVDLTVVDVAGVDLTVVDIMDMDPAGVDFPDVDLADMDLSVVDHAVVYLTDVDFAVAGLVVVDLVVVDSCIPTVRAVLVGVLVLMGRVALAVISFDYYSPRALIKTPCPLSPPLGTAKSAPTTTKNNVVCRVAFDFLTRNVEITYLKGAKKSCKTCREAVNNPVVVNI